MVLGKLSTVFIEDSMAADGREVKGKIVRAGVRGRSSVQSGSYAVEVRCGCVV